MDRQRAHPILSQISLLISPFENTAHAVTLPYTYQTLPQNLPAPSVNENDIHLLAHMAEHSIQVADAGHLDAIAKYQKWRSEVENQMKLERKRLAPGYLDSQTRILMPSRGMSGAQSKTDGQHAASPEPSTSNVQALERGIGSMGL